MQLSKHISRLHIQFQKIDSLVKMKNYSLRYVEWFLKVQIYINGVFYVKEEINSGGWLGVFLQLFSVF